MADETTVEQAKQLIGLLWRREVPPRPGGRGPKQTVSVDAVVRAAIALADRDGYAKVSIRAVAAELGLRPMSLYTYVPSKDALAVLMADAVADEDAPIAPESPLRDRMAAIARQARAELIAHPWLLEVPPWRLVLGPGRMRRFERQLAAIDDIGRSEVELDRVIAVLTEFATGNARMAVAARRETQVMTDAQWWDVHGPLLSGAMSPEAFPLASRVGKVVGELYEAPGDPDGAFDYGLNRLLDGILSASIGP
ncbi:putative TetR family transcriptional regulator [Nocardia brasiliensis NBRC 14402]|uniref:TetR/AcrR family transcriptional regulator n=1 Tax=Nocardia brasiliensis TaxID=37326 RepID=UPI0002F4D5AC|nr:TetR/AcrR family transcriptional regulator [Nocardia brasiliensis]ASF06242.1 TetR/AcrR family transcriptional regulator [Nocardia brasiliensis]GAJ82348.1 putative TetR family transcriptional regulator [Nocardia brasiliensis NBRC 14402]SUB53928.1 Tetracyclin repressor, C-terminal all-alpha domain [Nocardia brasiliensis]